VLENNNVFYLSRFLLKKHVVVPAKSGPCMGLFRLVREY